MPRATPRTTPPSDLTPRRIEGSLLVVEGFKDAAGTEWRPGDRSSLYRHAVRQAALERPSLFVMEYETRPVDLEWLAELDQEYGQQYQQLKRTHDEAEAARNRALREEFKEQERPDPKDLERRYKKQEAEREERRKQAGEEHERQGIENELAYRHRSGYHFDD